MKSLSAGVSRAITRADNVSPGVLGRTRRRGERRRVIVDAGGSADGSGAGTGAGTGSSRLKPWCAGRGAVSAAVAGNGNGNGIVGDGATGGVEGAGSGTGWGAAGGGSVTCGKGGGIGTASGSGTPDPNRTLNGAPAPASSPATPKCSASSRPCSNSDTSSPQARRRWDGSMEVALAATAAFDMLVWFI